MQVPHAPTGRAPRPRHELACLNCLLNSLLRLVALLASRTPALAAFVVRDAPLLGIGVWHGSQKGMSSSRSSSGGPARRSFRCCPRPRSWSSNCSSRPPPLRRSYCCPRSRLRCCGERSSLNANFRLMRLFPLLSSLIHALIQNCRPSSVSPCPVYAGSFWSRLRSFFQIHPDMLLSYSCLRPPPP